MLKAVYEGMLGKQGNVDAALRTLEDIKLAGMDGIELRAETVRPAGEVMSRLAPNAKYNWAELLHASRLRAVALETSLAAVKKSPYTEAKLANDLGAEIITVSGPDSFIWFHRDSLFELCDDLNVMGEALRACGIRLIYRTSNAELNRINGSGERALDYMLRMTDKTALGFQLDPAQLQLAGADPMYWLERSAERTELLRLADVGTRQEGASPKPRQKISLLEPGYGNMELEKLVKRAKELGCGAAILNVEDVKSPMESIEKSMPFFNKNVY